MGSNTIDFSGMTLPFSATDVLTSAWGLVGLFSTFIILGLVIMFFPKLVGLFKAAASALRGK